MRTLVWFRSDLRLHDNPALHDAVRAAEDGVLAVFVLCPQQWREHDWGTMRVDFVLRHAAALSDALAARNLALKIVRADRFADVPGKLAKLVKDHAVDAVYFNEELEVNERRRDDAVGYALQKLGTAVYRSRDQLVLDPDSIRTQAGDAYKVYSQFRKTWHRLVDIDTDLHTLPVPRKRREMVSAPDTVPETLKGFAGHTRPDLWPSGEKVAGKMTEDFLRQRGGPYESQRDFPGVNGTSRLSPYLAAGVVSTRQVLQMAVAANKGQADKGDNGLAHWIGELLWREFYRYILYHYPRVCMGKAFRAETDRIEWRYDENQFQAWRHGRTGVPIVDAAMRQLTQTGWMHNRCRMIAAMYLTKDLFIDWRWGERFFMNHLVDGDFASNNGGWQWSASTGTDSAPYFRIFNPISQSRKCDPNGDYIRKFLPELADLDNNAIHEPHADGGLLAPEDYPPPIVDHKAARERVMRAFRARK